MQNKPNLPKPQNNHNLSHSKEIREYTALRPGKKQTQSNPIPNLPASLPPSIRFHSISFYESGEGNSWQFKEIMVQISVSKGLNYVFERFRLINVYFEQNFEKAGDMKSKEFCRGFTLIELLVVISIISMLMAISLPSLGNAKEKGERVHCMANMKNLTTSWITYALENNDRLCSAETDWNEGGTNPWVADGPMIPTNFIGGTDIAIKNGALWPYNEMLEVYKCKSDSTKLLRSYAISRAMAGKTCNCEHDNIKPFLKWGNIKHQDSKMVFVDAASLTNWIDGSFCPVEDIDAVLPEWFRRDSRNISARHSNGTNLSFADGHCDYWKYKDVRTTKLAQWDISSSEASQDNADLAKMVELLHGR
jgi:prepilin-type N-terminal cleavage/methylation domain-containing protein/prepilin-type processing-associated H-X9-DG protein